MTNERETDRPEPGAAGAKALARRIRQHIVGKEHTFFAVVQPGFEETARDELREIGIRAFGAPVEGGVEFTSRLEGCYRVNLASRTVTRLIMRLTSFKTVEFGRLARKVEEFPWELHLAPGTAISLRITTRKSRLNRADRVDREVRRALEARLARDGLGPAPAEGPVQEVYVRLFEDRVTLSLDTSGGLLYLRGRKPGAVPASLRETLAALILREAGWPDYDVLVDPMCGSGTFSLEAAEIATGRLANEGRAFAFRRWPAFRPAAYRHLIGRMREETGDVPPRTRRILAADLDPAAVEAARGNLADAGLSAAFGEDRLRVAEADFLAAGPAAIPEDGRALVVLNPPYGKRLSEENTVRTFRRIGEILRARPDCGYAVIVPGLDLEKALSLGYDRKILFMNGGIRVAVIVRRAPERSTP